MTFVDDKGKGFALGATDYLTKPIDARSPGRVLSKSRGVAVPGPLLVVDDDEDARALLRRLLERRAGTCAEAAHGRAALAERGETPAELILLDLHDARDGRLRVRPRAAPQAAGRSIPVVVLTGKELSDEDRGRLNEHLVKVLRKGASCFEELLVEVRDLLKSRPEPL